jgi:hypothetical protein
MTQTAAAPTQPYRPVAIIRDDFMKFCQDACRSALFNHALYWIARKAKSESKEKIINGKVYWYATSEDIVKDLAHAWSEKKVRTESNALVTMGLLGRAKNPKMGIDRTKHFFFGPEQCKKLLDLCIEHQIYLQNVDLSKDVLQLIDMLLQTVNLPDANKANGQFAERVRLFYRLPSAQHAQANGQFTGAITQESNSGKYVEPSKPELQSANADIHMHLLFSFATEEEMIAYFRGKGMRVTPEESTNTSTGIESEEVPSVEETPHALPTTAIPVLSSATEVTHGETEKHSNSYSQATDPSAEKSAEKLLPAESPQEAEQQDTISPTPVAASLVKPAKPRRQKPTAAVSEIKPEKPPITLSERAQTFWDTSWSIAPWFQGVPPTLTQKAAERLEAIAKWKRLPTAEDVYKTRNWYVKKYHRQGFQLGNFEVEYPQYLSEQYQAPAETRELAATGTRQLGSTIVQTKDLPPINAAIWGRTL